MVSEGDDAREEYEALLGTVPDYPIARLELIGDGAIPDLSGQVRESRLL
jgi:hypothetical protein